MFPLGGRHDLGYSQRQEGQEDRLGGEGGPETPPSSITAPLTAAPTICETFKPRPIG